jgi:hypothetical protein
MRVARRMRKAFSRWSRASFIGQLDKRFSVVQVGKVFQSELHIARSPMTNSPDIPKEAGFVFELGGVEPEIDEEILFLKANCREIAQSLECDIELEVLAHDVVAQGFDEFLGGLEQDSEIRRNV